MAAHACQQEAVSGDPAGGFEHGQGAVDEVGRGSGLGQGGQRGAQRFGLYPAGGIKLTVGRDM
jgi:hypothetical protein